jgi:hypothetical protein
MTVNSWQYTCTPGILLLFVLIFCPSVLAAGNALTGRENWEYKCYRCHGKPLIKNSMAFSENDITANNLSLFASDPGALTQSAEEGFIIPSGNFNAYYDAGANTNIPMRTYAGTTEHKLGEGKTPTQFAIDVSAYFATFFQPSGSPTISSVKPGDAQVSVSFNAPKSDLTDAEYTVVASPGGFKASGNTSPIKVTGLSNGTAYTFNVTATSNTGVGTPSSASQQVTPLAPLEEVAKAVSAIPEISAVNGSQDAANAAGSSAAATTSSAIQTASEIPAPPVISVANEIQGNKVALVQSAASMYLTKAPSKIIERTRNTQAKVFFTAPKENERITGYTITALSEGVKTDVIVSGTKSPITVNGLINGNEYTFTETSPRATGSSLPSSRSNAIISLAILGD